MAQSFFKLLIQKPIALLLPVKQKSSKANELYGSPWDVHVIRNLGLGIRTCVDVGVGYGTPVLYEAFPDAFHVLIEPIKEYEPFIMKILEKYKGKYFLTSLGSKRGSALLNVEVEDLKKSSFFKRTSLTSTGGKVATREVPITTLDDLLASEHFPSPFGLKIDTEGFELEVIRGAKNFLHNTDLVIVEVSCSKRFENSYSFPELTEEMSQNGFYLYDILRTAGSNPVRFVDAAFRRVKTC